MMSIEYMQQLSREAAAEAAQEGLEPFVYFSDDEVGQLPFPIPNLGDYRPEGWEMETTHFVDSSGFGQEGEPALTFGQFQQAIRDAIVARAAEGKTVGFAIVEEGQFQVVVGEFTKPQGS